MNEITITIQTLQSKIAGYKRELQVLDTRGKNSVAIIRSKLDLFNLDDNEDLSDLDIESARIEMQELCDSINNIKEKKEKLKSAEKELSRIRKQLEV